MQATIQASTLAAGSSYSKLVPLRASGRALPLFCIHDGNFEQLASSMREDQPIYGLCPINLDEEGVQINLEQLAEDYLLQIRSVQARGPYQLAGYSIGALLAYEIATLLANRGERISLLALVGRGAKPKFQRDLSPAEWKRFRRTYFADRIRKYAKNLSEGRFDNLWSDAGRYIGKVKPVVWKIIQKVCNKLGFATPRFLRNREVIFSLIMRSYKLKQFKGRVVLFRPEERTPEDDLDPCMGWQKYAKEGVDVHFVPGDHGTMIQMPNVLVLAEKLVPYLKLSSGEVGETI
jgi:thioesterase domain-containing protein